MTSTPNASNLLRCNCSMCARRGVPLLQVAHDALQVVQGQGELSTYSFGTHMALHMFCKRCGVYTHHQPRSSVDHWNVNVCCLDEVDPATLGQIPWLDARHQHPNEAAGHRFYAHKVFLNARGLGIAPDADRPLRFWPLLPYDELRALFVERAAVVAAAAAPRRIWHVGSSSVRGMCGLLSVDLLCLSPVWPVDDALRARMAAAGFRCAGSSPHSGEDGVWFFLHDDPTITTADGVTHRGIGLACHFVRDGSDMPVKFLALREYCTRVPDGIGGWGRWGMLCVTWGEAAHRRYAELKSTLAAVEVRPRVRC